MSSICASSPYLAKTAFAATRIASRLRRASARRGLAVAASTNPNVGVDKRNVNSVCSRNRTGTQLPLHPPQELLHMSDAPPQDRKWLALALLAAAQFVVVLDASIVNVALP